MSVHDTHLADVHSANLRVRIRMSEFQSQSQHMNNGEESDTVMGSDTPRPASRSRTDERSTASDGDGTVVSQDAETAFASEKQRSQLFTDASREFIEGEVTEGVICEGEVTHMTRVDGETYVLVAFTADGENASGTGEEKRTRVVPVHISRDTHATFWQEFDTVEVKDTDSWAYRIEAASMDGDFASMDDPLTVYVTGRVISRPEGDVCVIDELFHTSAEAERHVADITRESVVFKSTTKDVVVAEHVFEDHITVESRRKPVSDDEKHSLLKTVRGIDTRRWIRWLKGGSVTSLLIAVALFVIAFEQPVPLQGYLVWASIGVVIAGGVMVGVKEYLALQDAARTVTNQSVIDVSHSVIAANVMHRTKLETNETGGNVPVGSEYESIVGAVYQSEDGLRVTGTVNGESCEWTFERRTAGVLSAAGETFLTEHDVHDTEVVLTVKEHDGTYDASSEWVNTGSTWTIVSHE